MKRALSIINYCERAQGLTPDFIAKLGIVLEEADEAGFWLELLVETSILEREAGQRLQREPDELTRIFVSSRETACRNARARASARARNRNQESRIKNHD
jgi:four helix bundle protein